MRLHGVLVVAAGLLLAADAAKSSDRESIQGEWKFTAVVQDGKEAPPARHEKMRIRFTSDKMIVTEGEEKHEATYKLDPDHKPPKLEVTPSDGPNKGKTGSGIYQLKGDTLTVCLTIQAGKKPPSDFTAQADSGRVLMTLERVKR